MEMPFGSEKVITEHIAKADLRTYLVGFDIDDKGQRYYRLESLVDLLQKVIPEFAFGYHEGKKIDITRITEILREAAKSIYRIKDFRQVKEIYEKGDSIPDDGDLKKVLERGEFGELILHLLLRDFCKTIPLLSKIYFKDAYSSTVHGFDAVHIQPETKILWLGESKLYVDGKSGVRALIGDIKEHFVADYLTDEFSIISKKLKPYGNIPEKDYWLELMDQKTKLLDLFKSISIPLLCTYTSSNFTKYNDETLEEFVTDYEKEVNELKTYFDEHNDHRLRTNMNIILLLFPVKCKNSLVRRMHEKLGHLQGI